MANQLDQNPMVLNTPSASALYSTPMNIQQIRFSGYANAADLVELQNAAGNTIALIKGNADFSDVVVTVPTRCLGLLFPVTKTDGNPNPTGGSVLVYLV